MKRYTITLRNVLRAAEILERQPALPALDYECEIEGANCFCIAGAIARVKNEDPGDLYEGYAEPYVTGEWMSPLFRSAVLETFPPVSDHPLPKDSDEAFARITWWNDNHGTPKSAADKMRQVARLMATR